MLASLSSLTVVLMMKGATFPHDVKFLCNMVAATLAFHISRLFLNMYYLFYQRYLGRFPKPFTLEGLGKGDVYAYLTAMFVIKTYMFLFGMFVIKSQL